MPYYSILPRWHDPLRWRRIKAQECWVKALIHYAGIQGMELERTWSHPMGHQEDVDMEIIFETVRQVYTSPEML